MSGGKRTGKWLTHRSGDIGHLRRLCDGLSRSVHHSERYGENTPELPVVSTGLTAPPVAISETGAEIPHLEPAPNLVLHHHIDIGIWWSKCWLRLKAAVRVFRKS